MDPELGETGAQAPSPGTAAEVLVAFLKLGLSSFGGPVAHLGYFRAELVARRGWLDARAYAEIVGLCQLLPGPTSSQVGFLLGLRHAGWRGAIAAWLGFTAPSAALMLLFAATAPALSRAPAGAGLLHGLKLAAVAVVAQAVWAMARSLCTDAVRVGIALAAGALAIEASTAIGQVAAILGGAIAGLVLCAGKPAAPSSGLVSALVSRRAGACLLAAFGALLVASVLLKTILDPWAAFVRSGALVFGGGHVVLPLLSDSLVAPGWVSNATFLAGYGAAQAMPGPLFAIAADLGAAGRSPLGGIGAGLGALVAIFLPGLLLAAGALPFWNALTAPAGARAAVAGVNAAVVGLLAAALYDPVWTGAMHGPLDVAVAGAAFGLLMAARAQPILVVAFAAAAGALLG